MFNNGIDKYLVTAGYTENSIIMWTFDKKWLPCLLPSSVFLDWQSC